MGARGKSYTHGRGTPSLPTGVPQPPPTVTRGDSVATTNDAQNITTRPSPRAPRLPRDALGSLSTPHMRGPRTGGARGSYRDVPGVYVKNPS